MKEISSANWKAWVNQQPAQPTPGGNLIVIGDVTSHPTKKPELIKKVPQGTNPAILLLDLVLTDSETPLKQPQQVRYEEGLETETQYTSIVIFFEENEEATIDEIPVVY